MVALGAISSMRRVQSPWVPPAPAMMVPAAASSEKKERRCVGLNTPRKGAASYTL